MVSPESLSSDSAEEASPLTLSTAQAAFFLSFACTVVFWLISEYLTWVSAKRDVSSTEAYDELQQVAVVKPGHAAPAPTHLDTTNKSDKDSEMMRLPSTGANNNNSHDDPSANKGENVGLLTGNKNAGSVNDGQFLSPSNRYRCRPSSGNMLSELVSSPLARCLMLDRTAIKQQRSTLRAMTEFGILMVWYFICDRTDLLSASGKSYSRDLFVFLFLLLTIVAFMTSLQSVKAPVFLVRQQTEEWKGWMQVLFLLYHYFEAKEAYNAIRIFIAGYVWMTGFGNFLYYYKTGDFSVGRFAQMMWRLNFLVFFACVVLRNSYMLYYICPMHTLFTVMVYACLGIASHLNQSRAWLLIKMGCCWLAVVVLWHKPVFYAVWSPLAWMVGYLDPRKPDEDDMMKEWFIRSSLDRYVWIYGMLCGMAQPACQAALTLLDSLPRLTQAAVRSGVIMACAAVGWVWYTWVFTLPRNEYNPIHPYTSWIPITLWAILRNITPTLRLHHLRLYGWLGCITLETYICQFHVWMRTTLPDGQPKQLLVLVPGYPLLNFMVVTAGYIFVSHRLFELTNTLKNAAVPHTNNALLLRNTLLMAIMGAGIYVVTAGIMPLALSSIMA